MKVTYICRDNENSSKLSGLHCVTKLSVLIFNVISKILCSPFEILHNVFVTKGTLKCWVYFPRTAHLPLLCKSILAGSLQFPLQE